MMDEDGIFWLSAVKGLPPKETRKLSKEEQAVADELMKRHWEASERHEGIYAPPNNDYTDNISHVDRPHKYDASKHHKNSLNLVWWDVNTFPPQKRRRAPHLLREITHWLRGKQRVGPVELYAYGDMDKMCPYLWTDLERLAAHCTHVPKQRVTKAFGGDEGPCFYTMYTDITMSTVAHLPPSNHLIISGDHRFETVGTCLEDECYGCILARPTALCCRLSLLEVVWKDIGIENVQ